MTEREKLVRTYKFLNWQIQKVDDGRTETMISLEYLKHLLEAIHSLCPDYTYQPTGRACFDKPAGTPIEHWETVETKARQAYMASRQDVTREMTQEERDGWTNTNKDDLGDKALNVLAEPCPIFKAIEDQLCNK